MYYDKDEIKQSLTIDQVFDFLVHLGGDPIKKNGYIISKTICHNPPHEGSYKLWYYDNTKLFRCWTDCPEESGFDIFSLVQKQKQGTSLYNAISYVANFFGISNSSDGNNEFFDSKSEDWNYFESHKKNKEFIEQEKEKKEIELKVYDDSILRFLPFARISSWEKEGIKRDVYYAAGIRYDPLSHGVVIPHYSIDNKLVGIRERTLIKEEEQYGKYKPAILRKVMYAHPLGLNLYNLNNSKENIKKMRKALLYEGEKSPLLFRSLFGYEMDFSVAVCGSNLTQYQFDMLFKLGVDEVIIAFDKQFTTSGTEEFKRWTNKLTDIHNKYHNYCLISFLFDKWGMLDYKDSPIDKGKDIFLELYKRRITL